VALVLEEAGQNLFEGALPVAEPETIPSWDRIQLAVGERGDSPEGVARGRELRDDHGEIDVVGRVPVVVLAGFPVVFEVATGSVAEGPEKPRDAMIVEMRPTSSAICPSTVA
jgi:hypothetical protein